MQLILDEIRVLPVAALHVPSPRSPALQALCEALRLARQRTGAWPGSGSTVGSMPAP
jgi:hypothetical protein